MNLFGYFDAAYGVHLDYKSQSASFLTLGKGPILVSCKKQKILTKSSTEAEIVAASDGSPTVVGVRRFLKAQGYKLEPSVIYQDNMSTMSLIKKGRPTSEASKHINIRHFFIKQLVDEGEIRVMHMPTEDMLADLLTKPLQGMKFRRLRDKLMNISN